MTSKPSDLTSLYPKYNCPICKDWFHLPYKFCKCDKKDGEEMTNDPSEVNAVTLRDEFVYPRDHTSLGLCSHTATYVNKIKYQDLLDRLEAMNVKPTWEKLYLYVKEYVEKHELCCEEDIHQSDTQQENAAEFLEKCCEIVGYHDNGHDSGEQ